MSDKDELPTEMKHAIENFDSKLGELEAVMAPFLNEEKSLLPRLSALDTAKLNLTVSYAIATLFALYLKTQGVSHSDHPVKKELDRIKQHLQKLTTASEADLDTSPDGAAAKKRKAPEGGNIEEESPNKKPKRNDSKSSK